MKASSFSLASTVASAAFFLLTCGAGAVPPQYAVTVLEVPGFGGVAVTGINNLGQIAGYGNRTGEDVNTGFRMTGGTVTVLGRLAGGTEHITAAINETGVIVGTYIRPTTSELRAVRWGLTTPTLPQNLPGTIDSMAFAINASGQIAGVTFQTILAEGTSRRAGRPEEHRRFWGVWPGGPVSRMASTPRDR